MEFAQILIDNQKPQLVQDILIAEKRYLNLVHTFQMRNEIKDEIDIILAESGFGHGAEFRLGSVLEKIGPQKMAVIYDLTEKYIELLDESIVYIHDTINKLINTSGDIFKDYDRKGSNRLLTLVATVNNKIIHLINR
jgi:hypothetical protein